MYLRDVKAGDLGGYVERCQFLIGNVSTTAFSLFLKLIIPNILLFRNLFLIKVGRSLKSLVPQTRIKPAFLKITNFCPNTDRLFDSFPSIFELMFTTKRLSAQYLCALRPTDFFTYTLSYYTACSFLLLNILIWYIFNL